MVGLDGFDDLTSNPLAANAPNLGEAFSAGLAATTPLDAAPAQEQVAALTGRPVIGASSIPPNAGNVVTDPRGLRNG